MREFRVSPSVIHLTTGRMVRAYDLARREQADVLSMSMGGLPSEALADAVDAAYDAGVAMFTAAGDFLQPPLLPVRSPKSIVYPARFRRVIAVTGATADRKTYARAPSAFSWLRGKVGSWALRGSYGPLSAMDHALAGYTPNVPWAVLSRVPPSNLVDLDGAGTSASTPQVAAAAALWLERHRAGFGDADWRSWKKTEAAYRPLLAAADAGPAGAARARRYYRTYFGAGLLRARDALDEVWIWTDVDGVMTTDPRSVPEARSIPKLSYREIAELAYFGAKVLHPKTIRPVIEAGIGLRICNTFNPDHPGTRIVNNGNRGKGVIKAVTAIRGQCLITVEGRGMLGVPGVAARTFGAVASTKTSVPLITQASSEQSICFAVPKESVESVITALNDTFLAELSNRDIDRVFPRPRASSTPTSRRI